MKLAEEFKVITWGQLVIERFHNTLCKATADFDRALKAKSKATRSRAA